MSFTLKAEQLSQSFIQTCGKLNQRKLPFKYAWHMKTLATKLDKALDFVTESYTQIVKENSELDKDGNLVPKVLEEDMVGPDGKVMREKGFVIPNSYVPKNEEAEKAIKDSVEELMKSDIKIDYSKLPVTAIENLEISAEELDVIEPILDISEAVKNNVIKK